jgi:hypothetical protein
MTYETKPGLFDFFGWLRAYPGRSNRIEYVIWRSNLMHWWIWPWFAFICAGVFWLVLGLVAGRWMGL